MFALFLFPSALKHIKKENRTIITVLFLAVAVVAPFTVIYSIWESGYGVRYMIDFAWQMLMCAILIIFMLYRHTKHEETKRIYRYAMLISMILCVIVSFALTYSYIYPTNLPAGAVTMFEKIARAFCVFNT
jgi:drug/metabolite transporter (DMT)-like permease